MNVRPLFITNTQPPELIEPRKGSFYHPTPASQTTAVFGITLRKEGHNISNTQSFPDGLAS